MKANLRVVVYLIAILLTSCTKENITPPEPDTQEMAVGRNAIESVTVSLLAGNWQVAYYTKAGTEKTEAFRSYNFKFIPNGSLVATINGQNLVGKWVIAYIDNQTRLSIDFSYPALFVEMSGDWNIIEETDTKVKLQDILIAKDRVTFEKS